VWRDAASLPELDLREVSAVADLVRSAVADGLLDGAHDIADGGLADALGEMAAKSGVGARLSGVAGPEELFSEASGRVVVSVSPAHLDEMLRRADTGGVPVADLGEAGGARFVIDGLVDLTVDALVGAYRGALPAAMAAGATH
jgi:phosphoribosylformylglycinamidine synthase